MTDTVGVKTKSKATGIYIKSISYDNIYQWILKINKVNENSKIFSNFSLQFCKKKSRPKQVLIFRNCNYLWHGLT